MLFLQHLLMVDMRLTLSEYQNLSSSHLQKLQACMMAIAIFIQHQLHIKNEYYFAVQYGFVDYFNLIVAIHNLTTMPQEDRSQALFVGLSILQALDQQLAKGNKLTSCYFEPQQVAPQLRMAIEKNTTVILQSCQHLSAHELTSHYEQLLHAFHEHCNLVSYCYGFTQIQLLRFMLDHELTNWHFAPVNKQFLRDPCSYALVTLLRNQQQNNKHLNITSKPTNPLYCFEDCTQLIKWLSDVNNPYHNTLQQLYEFYEQPYFFKGAVTRMLSNLNISSELIKREVNNNVKIEAMYAQFYRSRTAQRQQHCTNRKVNNDKTTKDSDPFQLYLRKIKKYLWQYYGVYAVIGKTNTLALDEKNIFNSLQLVEQLRRLYIVSYQRKSGLFMGTKVPISIRKPRKNM